MLERFTERSRKVMNLARQEAERLHSGSIGAEHLLLGIILEGGGIAATVLKNLGADLKRIHQEIQKLVDPSASPPVALGQLPFSPRARRAIELANKAAGQFGLGGIGAEHMLLGLLKVKKGIAAQVLTHLGLEPDEVRDLVLEAIAAFYPQNRPLEREGGEGGGPPPVPGPKLG